MGQKQTHRGKHPADEGLFNSGWLPKLCAAVDDLSLLLSRGYSEKSALKLVGDHYQLTVRQRRGVLGASCSDEALEYRNRHRRSVGELKGQCLAVDGYNLLIA